MVCITDVWLKAVRKSFQEYPNGFNIFLFQVICCMYVVFGFFFFKHPVFGFYRKRKAFFRFFFFSYAS